MAGLNRMILTGHLTRDPEIRYTKNEVPVARFTVAVNGFKKKDKEAEVNYFNCIAWRGLAGICGEYLKKGSSVAIEGKLRVRPYELKGVKKTATEILVDNMLMLDKKFPHTAPVEAAQEAEVEEDDLVMAA